MSQRCVETTLDTAFHEELKLMAMGLLSGIRALAWAIVLLMDSWVRSSWVVRWPFGGWAVGNRACVWLHKNNKKNKPRIHMFHQKGAILKVHVHPSNHHFFSWIYVSFQGRVVYIYMIQI